MASQMIDRGSVIDILLMRLMRDHGGSKHRWRKVIGQVKVYTQSTHPHCNWGVSPSGSSSDVASVETLLDELRLTYPIIKA